MITTVHRPPRFDARAAAGIARERWGLAAMATPLPSERDQNFLLAGVDGARWVLKLAAANEERALLECQNAAIGRLAAAGTRFLFPQPLPALDGAHIVEVGAPDGGAHLARVMTWVPGEPLADARPQSPALLHDVGALAGTVDRVLAGFAHPAAERAFHWDLRRAGEVIARHAGALTDARDRALVDGFAPLLARLGDPDARLRQGVIHGDANDYNVVVARADRSAPSRDAAVVGLIDFGDMVRSWVVGELAVACAYAMLGKRDPLAAAAHVVAGYDAERALDDDELDALYPLICARLCTSLVLSAHQRAARPENEYLSISRSPVLLLLARLAAVSDARATGLLRAACGRDPLPGARAVVQWFARRSADFAPLLPALGPLHDAPVLDLSVGAASAAGADHHGESAAIAAAVRAAGATCAIGRHAEVRAVPADEALRVSADDADEWRTLHLGVDVFAPPGTPVHAPLDGRVHAVYDEPGAAGEGVTLLLRHEPEPGVAFGIKLAGLDAAASPPARGGAVRRGDVVGAVGAAADGGASAHLHVQIVVDPLEEQGPFPALVPPSERSFWLAASPDPHVLLGVPPLAAPAPDSPDALLARRRAAVSPSLSVSYRRPLVIVRGRGRFLYDAAGQPYLDAVNNVAHVGHGHPRVTDALLRQSAVLNTNTRYLHRLLEEYAERLAATLPAPLRVCTFVCSGSEANELALRMARAHTRRRDVVVLEGGYHGNTTTLIELSPYKFDGPGGQGRAPHVHVAPLPDPYRGRHRGPDAGARYVEEVKRLVDGMVAQGRPPCALLAEALPGCGGQVVPPDGFLARAFDHVRAAGGVCIADEVQTGLGRVGTHFWAFETQAAVPDIVTVGKPIGNGHPLGAVITTPEIARSFDDGMEYFNTFGGNPVSCAVGLAVLDVIADERLQDRARTVGARLLEGLRDLMDRHDVVGDVRGRGLYVGAELVLDRAARTPAGALAAHVANRMRDHGILISTDGPDHNVLKIKPPLVFGEDDADRLVATLDAVLGEDAARAI